MSFILSHKVRPGSSPTSGVSVRRAVAEHACYLLSEDFFSLPLHIYVFSLQFRPREVSISFCSITDLSLVYFLHPAYSSFLACNAKLQLPSTIAKMDSGSIPTKATHLGLLPTFMDGKHHSMDTVSLYLAIKVIHSSCYIADLFRITPTAHPEANKLLKQREINLPKPISGLSNYI